jgi:hypothetical protein
LKKKEKENIKPFFKMYESPIFRKKMTKLKKNARKGGKKNKENK